MRGVGNGVIAEGFGQAGPALRRGVLSVRFGIKVSGHWQPEKKKGEGLHGSHERWSTEHASYLHGGRKPRANYKINQVLAAGEGYLCGIT